MRNAHGAIVLRKDGQPRRKPGRKKTGKRLGGPHRTRPEVDARFPIHVVLRSANRGVWRRAAIYGVFRRVLGHCVGRGDFRVCHLSIQNTHVHLIVEAANKRALSRRMQSLVIRAARGMNAAGERRSFGKVFGYRYHASPFTTARYARHALAYVLNNWRRHREDFANGREIAAHLDPYSSAVSFDGWTMRFARHPTYQPLPVSPPETALLRYEWKRFGRIDPGELPGPLW